jgi:adenine-specific DNA methylase
LLQRFCAHDGLKVNHFDVPNPDDLDRSKSRAQHIPPALRERIPIGRETEVLRRTGFACWAELYPPRQLRVLLNAAKIARGLACDRRIKNRLQLCIVGAAEMAGYLCRWDRFHPKAFEALANHHFSALGLAVETNPVGHLGRGTLRRRLRASIEAACWIKESRGEPSVENPRSRKRKDLPPITVVSGSSEKQRLRTGSVRLVVTDPPYYDAIQYGELASLFLAWSRVVKPHRTRWRVQLDQEAVPNSIRGNEWKDYERQLCKIFRETARTLATDGRVLLTYHSTDFRGWASLGAALFAASLRVVGLAVASSENETDHAKRDRLAFTKDLIIECELRQRGLRRIPVVKGGTKSEERELIAAGRALALHGGGNARSMASNFLQQVSRFRKRRIKVMHALRQDVDNHAGAN